MTLRRRVFPVLLFEVGGQAVLGRQDASPTPWLTERHGYDPTSGFAPPLLCGFAIIGSLAVIASKLAKNLRPITLRRCVSAGLLFVGEDFIVALEKTRVNTG